MLYVIGDIHGYSAQLDRALGLIAADGGAEAPVVFLGDYTDRGPDSRGVLQRLIDGQADGRDWTCLKGNHDRMFWRFVERGEPHDAHIKSGKGWLNSSLGGDATLASYGIVPTATPRFGWDADHREVLLEWPSERGDLDTDGLAALAREAVPQAHRDFIAGLPLTHRAEGHLFVHAGIRPGVPLEDQAEDDLVWIRDGWLDNEDDHGIVVVHGHTALKRPTHFGNRIDLDAGAGYGNPLVPAVLEDGDWFTLSETGRTPLRPA